MLPLLISGEFGLHSAAQSSLAEGFGWGLCTDLTHDWILARVCLKATELETFAKVAVTKRA